MKYNLLLLSAALTLTISGCSDINTESPDTETPPTIHVSVEASHAIPQLEEQTRAILAPGLSAQWEESDQIAIFASSYIDVCNQQTLSATQLKNDNQSATFSGDIVEPENPDTFYAVHPATATVNCDYARFELPALQTATATPNIMMCAKSEPSNIDLLALNFVPVDAFLRVTLTNSATEVSQIIFEACDGVAVAGEYTYDFETKAISVTGSGKSITVDTQGLTEFYIAVPAITLEKGYKLTFSDGDGQQMIRSYNYNTGKTFTAGCVYNVEVADFAAITAGMTWSNACSYDFYINEGAEAANTKNNATIYGSDIHYTVTGISSTLIEEIGVIVDGTEIPTTSWDKQDKTFSIADLTDMTWGEHTAQMYIKYNGGGVTVSETKDIVITGLPYTAAPLKKEEWTTSGTVIWSDPAAYVQLGSNRAACSITSKATFYTPQNIDIKVEMNCHINTVGTLQTRRLRFYVYIGDTAIFAETYNGGREDNAEYTLTSENQAILASSTNANSITCSTADYGSTNPMTANINSISVMYR